ncbi:uncharacterized protein LOC114468079 isoform X2 [Gouania willdenowi]|nr:uncharacterized protein LOC114468079 isoform X2 [Gouania willdenowi]
MHITIQKGRSIPALNRCTTCCDNYHCPFCCSTLFRPQRLSKVMTHVESHFNRAVLHEGYTIHRCGLNCRPRCHYHCIYCQSTLLRKEDFIKHLSLCNKKHPAPVSSSPASATTDIPASATDPTGLLHLGSVEETKELVRLRNLHDDRFTARRNAAKQAWEFLIQEMELEGKVTHKQASKKWENLKKKYKDLRKTLMGSGVDQGSETANTWCYYADLHEAFGSQPLVSPPVLVSSCLPEPTIFPPELSNKHSLCPSPVTISPPSPTPTTSAPSSSLPRKRKCDPILDFLRQEAEKEERRHLELTAQNERFLKAFEKMVDKM